MRILTNENEERNPYQELLDHPPKWRRKPETREQFLKRKSKEYEEAKSAKETAKAEQDAKMTPARKRAIEKAELTLRELRYDPTATRTDIDAAEARLTLARDGELSDFAVATRDWIATRDERAEAELKMIQSKIDLLREQQQQLKNHAFELPEVEEVPSV